MQITSQSLNPQDWIFGAWNNRSPVRYRMDRNSRILGVTIDTADIGCEILDPVRTNSDVRSDDRLYASTSINPASLDYI